MKKGHLSTHFAGVGVKSLSATEVDPAVSRGHELQGVDAIQAFLGVPTEKRRIPARYVWLSDDEEPLSYGGEVTWYDSRSGQARREPEPRLYYPKASESIVYRARAGDTLFVCYENSGALTLLFCSSGSTIERQLLWLFDLSISGDELVGRNLRTSDVDVGVVARHVLGLIGIDSRVEDAGWLSQLTRAFGSTFPTTAKFSAFARKAAGSLNIKEDPDAALMRWIEIEELLFYTFERHLISERLEQGFSVAAGVDVDGFVQFSLSVQNRRKSRAGYSLENHLQAIFDPFDLVYARGTQTEGKRKPDFLFPGPAAYHDPMFPAGRLTLLGAKSSCKDRWRQVLSEAARIPEKHLLTLEPGISVNQTEEMKQERLQLVLPKPIHETYQASQRNWLMSVSGFIDLALSRQTSA